MMILDIVTRLVEIRIDNLESGKLGYVIWKEAYLDGTPKTMEIH